MDERITKLFKVLVIGGALSGCARVPEDVREDAPTAEAEPSSEEPADDVEAEANDETSTGVDSWLSWT